MAKNNLIPKGNKAQIVEVREIKSEIPSYEEFLKDYNQERVNYGDLTHEDLNSIKGYGPCAWRNSQYGERWTSLRMPCPASGCGNSAVSNLTHAGCGGNLEVSNKARIQCGRCETVNQVSNFPISCSNHSGYGSSNINSFQDSLMVALNNGSMDIDIIMELLRCLRSGW